MEGQQGQQGDLSAKEIIAELRKGEKCSERAIISCSRQASSAAFSKEFVVFDGLKALLDSMQLVNQQRATKANVLRALTLLLEDKWSRDAMGSIAAEGGITVNLLSTLLQLVLSDTVLTVARALHVLSAVTEPALQVDKSILRKAFESVSTEKGRRLLACLRPAFVGFALLDANLHGLSVLAHLLAIDSSYLRAMEDAQLPQAIFALCENEALSQHIAAFQEAQLKCWKGIAATQVNMDLPEHLALLERLWAAVGTGKQFPGRTSPEWKELGFQGDSPASDFRGMGMLGLEQLLFYCETCTTEARMVFVTQNTAENDLYYPVATAGVICSSLVLNAAESILRTGEMCPVFLSAPDAFHRVWIVLFRHIDTIFVEQGLRYLQFSELTKGVTAQLNDCLRQRPLSCEELAGMLKACGLEGLGIANLGTPKKRNKVRSAVWPTTNALRAKDRSLSNPPIRVEETFASAVSPTPISKSALSASAKTVRNPRGTKAIGKRLRKAAAHGDAKKIIELLAQDDGYAVVNDPDPDEHTTALHAACSAGSADCVTLLCGAGAAVDAHSTMGTPLHCAAAHGHVAIMRLLLEAGAKKDSPGPKGRQPLAEAAKEGHEAAVRLLLECGADPLATDLMGNTAADLWAGDRAIGVQLLGEPVKHGVAHISAPVSRLSPPDAPNTPLQTELKLLRNENAELKKIVQSIMGMMQGLEKRIEQLENCNSKK